MSNQTTTLPQTYEPSKAAAGVLAGLVGISLIAWLVQSIRVKFKPRRPMVLILISHLTIFIVLILRAALSTDQRNSKAGLTVISLLLAIGQRMIILSNYDILTQVGNLKSYCTRMIIIGSMIGILVAIIIVIPAGTLSKDPNTIYQSVQLREASAGIVLSMTILFYPIWFATKTVKYMTKLVIVLLIISSITSLIVAIYLLITSIPKYYAATNQHEFWFYIFQITPILIALFTWTILHPMRSLVSTQQQEQEEEPPQLQLDQKEKADNIVEETEIRL